jgi:hypothetical protein
LDELQEVQIEQVGSALLSIARDVPDNEVGVRKDIARRAVQGSAFDPHKPRMDFSSASMYGFPDVYYEGYEDTPVRSQSRRMTLQSTSRSLPVVLGWTATAPIDVRFDDANAVMNDVTLVFRRLPAPMAAPPGEREAHLGARP